MDHAAATSAFDRLRVTVFWNLIARTRPRATSRVRRHRPAAYPAEGWQRYDTIVRLAGGPRIGVNFQVWGAMPVWAAAGKVRTIFGHFSRRPPSIREFMTAIGRRYDGTYPVTWGHHARVAYWSMGKTSPTGFVPGPNWQRPRGHRVETGPPSTASLSAAGVARADGHATCARDTVLVGRTAAQGQARCRLPHVDPAPVLHPRPYCVDGGKRR